MRIMHTYHLRRPVVNSARKIIPGFPRRFHRTWNVVSVPTVGRSSKFLPWVFVWVLLFAILKLGVLQPEMYKSGEKVWKNGLYPTECIQLPISQSSQTSLSALLLPHVCKHYPRRCGTPERKPKLQNWSHVETTHHWISDEIWTKQKWTWALIETCKAAFSAMPRIIWNYILLRYNFLDDFHNPVNHS